jgi:hypothetical protein
VGAQSGNKTLQFDVRRDKEGGPISGSFQYFDAATSTIVQSTAITGLTVAGNRVTFEGTCVAIGRPVLAAGPCTFRVEAVDNGSVPVGGGETVRVTVSGLPTVEGVLRVGDVSIKSGN